MERKRMWREKLKLKKRNKEDKKGEGDKEDGNDMKGKVESRKREDNIKKGEER